MTIKTSNTSVSYASAGSWKIRPFWAAGYSCGIRRKTYGSLWHRAIRTAILVSLGSKTTTSDNCCSRCQEEKEAHEGEGGEAATAKTRTLNHRESFCFYSNLAFLVFFYLSPCSATVVGYSLCNAADLMLMPSDWHAFGAAIAVFLWYEFLLSHFSAKMFNC